MLPSSDMPRNVIVSVVGGHYTDINFASASLPTNADPRIVLIPQEISIAESNLHLPEHIANALSTSLSSYSLLLQAQVTEVWRELHRQLLRAIVSAIPSRLTLREIVFNALVFPTLEDLVSACQVQTEIRSVHLVGVRWLGPSVLPHPAKNYVPPTTFQLTELRISKILESMAGILLLDGLKDTLAQLVLDVPAASRITGNGSEECHAPEVPHNRNNTIVMAQLASFTIELGMMEKPDGPAELEVEKTTLAVDEQLANVRPLFSRIVMPRAEVILRLRYEPSDKASDADLAHVTDEFVEGRGVLFAVADGLAPSVRGFSNFLQERHLGVLQASNGPSVKIEVARGAFLGGLLVWNREGARMGPPPGP